jgi:hypothetical protein
LKERNLLEDLGADWRIILKWNLKKYVERMGIYLAQEGTSG